MNRLIIIICIFFALSSKAQDINWVTFDELPNLSQQDAKPIMVFIHTDWCRYCLMQEQKTFKDSIVVADLNENYYCVKLNAETDSTISFLNRDYSANGYNHTLSWVLGAQDNQLSFPTTVILSPQYKLTNRWVGFLSKDLLGLTM